MRPFGFTYGAKPEWVDVTLSDFRYLDSYSDSVQASGTAPVRYSIVSGALPTGLSLNTTTGAITGSTTATGTYNFTIQARNHLGTITQSFTKAVPQAPIPPTYVSSNGGPSNNNEYISVSMGSRQAGDIGIFTFSGWRIGNLSGSTNPAPVGWTQVFFNRIGASVIQPDGNTIENQYAVYGSYYRVMTNTSADTFQYSLPHLYDVVLYQYLIVRPAPGMTFTASGGETGGQTANAAALAYDIPPYNTYFKLASFSANSLPKTVVATNHSLGQITTSGPDYSVGSGAGATVSFRWWNSVSNPTAMTRQYNNAYYTTGYISGFTDSSADGVFIGRFRYDNGDRNFWHFNSHAILTWSRV
jgi:hypothetical protein